MTKRITKYAGAPKFGEAFVRFRVIKALVRETNDEF